MTPNEVRRMFAEIAPKYDFLNHLLSFNIDRWWRRTLRKRLASVLERHDAKILDLCCGTGDVLLNLQRVAKGTLYGADFCHPMLVAAREKGARALFEADALTLPIASNALDAITVAFGFRNLADYAAGLVELHRVLKPGGVLAILEFSHPRGLLMRAAYGFYSRALLPAVGTLISGSREAYAYLPNSIRKFPQAEELRQWMNTSGFPETRYELLTGGIAALHLGTKSGSGRVCQPSLDVIAKTEISH
ncbi:MAG: bifunctional demethylmenaquinone methyltransferase/2-methoxy-6-polyprenyl-1,4-benzoquinol methylase UbiE [Bryobacteraceae bacterium]